MKCAINTVDQTVLFTAETPEDLEFICEMRGPHYQGPWRNVELLDIPLTELGFDSLGKGWSYGGDETTPPYVLGVARLKMGWMEYAEPKTQEFKDRQNAALGLGYSMINCFKLAVGDAQKSLDAG